ncbi:MULTISPECIES: bifunctional UDP-N-acetylmuramoyl-tripeptide:D-alanyl-D-alanine ligase/alanine racemase [unclassified Mucilaginibacter]|uniref:bifunctional UDP-N-acetylmuramoyl-tripeptide:D-alanyl-D-alanine ligase/alanine racemase n=1 Tax=unclassified Mucilaginibacter TaxID=2617802 RepID=UPI002AC947AC|nr:MULTISPECIES: bifunctional UDP-N-acetylmuramoyl-tripeptide:D-alanyl-D-alanine ligase/alanine racemase [unclassified Mucilaginibacter]MEB0262676.1 bifunctional UDP-N-acetylmuramoyl-tripeptide:D-alanyl-D-alanine ligase/alanine racemase [Mucilaginibacter sp. 10I4]MEB0279901.1 bifunctional UDP-N-acetylmuramoyl-tripeptide:D-alanyl-D-alanine ligase/alanine racemase [Mucilaginibacter sp. 10B2]MEB0300047.1 bifunctional UDP-N-acetylmuramoyl-tripeptide:D-alanyl-D-alanine ligase/alanine racemase [Mucila
MQNSYAINDVKQIINATGEIVSDATISVLLTDSRRVNNPACSLFFALAGRRDGHEFIADTYSAGVRNFVVNHQPDTIMPDANFLVVADVSEALQVLAAHHRKQFSLDVIGITGSNGKTIVKEWLYQLMNPEKSIVRNPKSYNSQIGVPLSVWQINKTHNLGIFEAGISVPGEMDKLEAIIQPTIGVLTHIGTAHDEGFETPEDKLIEKLKLFKNCKQIVYNYEALLDHQEELKSRECFVWSRKFNLADLYVFSETTIEGKYYMRAIYKEQEIECLVPFRDEASVENAIVCWATMLAMGYSPEDADERIERLSAVSMRLELKHGINDCSIIDDSYNSDIQSLEIALNFLNQQNQHQKKTLILSDIYQSGLQQEALYKQVAQMINAKQVDRFVGVGTFLQDHKALFNVPQTHFYADTASLLKDLSKLHLHEETILIKGSRSFEFEKISRALVQKAHETVLEINLNTLLSNLNFYKAKLEPGVKIMAMVKAFSYGSGTFEVANMLQYNQVDYLAVAYTDEGIALRETGITLPIMVLNPEPLAYDKLVANKLEPAIYSFTLLDEFVKFAQEEDVLNYPVHIKIDSGMHRVGFEAIEVETLCDLLEINPYIQVQSVYSHFVASDNEQHDLFTIQQIQIFETAYKQIEEALGYTVIKHISNTSGISRWPNARYDMVRLGIGLYGVDAAVPRGESGLQPVATLKTTVSQVKKMPSTETVSYNRSGSLKADGKIATVRIGYADGYVRAFGNGVGKMLVNGTLVPTVGNITMDMCMLDVSNVEVKEGDEVIVFNQQQRIEDLAQQIGTIPYEILTNISQRVKRVYFYE